MNATMGPRWGSLDIAHRPVRIQDVPRDILLMYGIFVDSEELSCSAIVPFNDKNDDTDDDYENNLVIDEDRSSPPLEETPVLVIHVVPADTTANGTKTNRKRPNEENCDYIAGDYGKRFKSYKFHNYSAQNLKFEAGQTRHVTLPVHIPSSTPPKAVETSNKNTKNNRAKQFSRLSELLPSFLGVGLCSIGKKEYPEISVDETKVQKCFQAGCQDFIYNEGEYARHLKMHEHPTKPFMCRFCKKRFRFYINAAKHEASVFCKARRKTKKDAPSLNL